MASAYVALGNYQSAQKNYTRAIGLAPDNGAYYFNLGLLYYKSGNIEAAMGKIQRSRKNGE